ncbi:hypothetical protein TNCV_1477841 [Trichonephila clavipes]|nr:hypothetical protein TNCV_1477841 [Trichonephila clavipes]
MATVSDNNLIIGLSSMDCQSLVLDCHHESKNLASLGKTIVLQWVPAHCGVPACAQEDFYNCDVYRFSKNVIVNLRNGPWCRAIAEFRLAIGHDCLRNHMYRFKFVPSAALKRS